MVRMAFRCAMGVLLAALATGCLGGQTGQPTSNRCSGTDLSPDDPWEITTVRAAAEAFNGTYDADLRWQNESRSATTHTLVDLADSLQLAITYDGEGAIEACGGATLSVPVTVTLGTSASGIAESGDATLTILASAGALTGQLHYASARIMLDATLGEVAAGGTIAGDCDALDPTLPGASASFGGGP